MRATGLFNSYGFDEGKASRMAQLIKEPMKMVRRVKAVCQVFVNHRDTRYYATTPEQIKQRLTSKLRYSFRQPMLNLGFTDAQIEQMVDAAIADNATVSEKKRLEWHDSNAPDANGKFKELGVNALADWLIKTRGKNLQKISGSLNQQIAFNKKKNPSYAAKMEKTREAVKRKLGKSND
jgi:conjugal transfer/entry exclusion protein